VGMMRGTIFRDDAIPVGRHNGMKIRPLVRQCNLRQYGLCSIFPKDFEFRILPVFLYVK